MHCRRLGGSGGFLVPSSGKESVLELLCSVNVQRC